MTQELIIQLGLCHAVCGYNHVDIVSVVLDLFSETHSFFLVSCLIVSVFMVQGKYNDLYLP